VSDVDAQIERARAAMERIAEGYRDAPARRRAAQSIGKRLTRIAVADAAILLAAFVIGLVMPLGIMGALLVMMLLVAATVTLAIWPAEGRAPPPEKLRTVDLKALPAQTERWLGAQRPALPAPARTLVDRIGQRLDVLSPQLGRVDGETETGLELRRLIGEQLPAFVNDYQRVPTTLRGVERNGRTPDAELVDGLKLIEQEIAEMTERLAQGDLDQLQTRGRFLEMKYRGDPAD
jgi:hypothetical protein